MDLHSVDLEGSRPLTKQQEDPPEPELSVKVSGEVGGELGKKKSGKPRVKTKPGPQPLLYRHLRGGMAALCSAAAAMADAPAQ